MTIELFDIPRFFTAQVTDYTITDSFVKAVELITPSLSAGTYLIGYAFEMNLDTKDKAISFRLGGTFASAIEFEESSSSVHVGDYKNRAYWVPKVFAGGGPITVSLDFKKDPALNSAILTFVDVLVSRVA